MYKMAGRPLRATRVRVGHYREVETLSARAMAYEGLRSVRGLAVW
jgi:hypothetical protein